MLNVQVQTSRHTAVPKMLHMTSSGGDKHLIHTVIHRYTVHLQVHQIWQQYSLVLYSRWAYNTRPKCIHPGTGSVRVLMRILISCEWRRWETTSLQSSTGTQAKVSVVDVIANVPGGFSKPTADPGWCWAGRGSTWQQQDLPWMDAPAIRSPSSFPQMPERYQQGIREEKKN